MLTSTIFATGAVLLAVADRLIVERKAIDCMELGEPSLREGFIDFPMKYVNRRRKLRGARVEYWLFNTEDPTHVITGKHRTLDLANNGVNQEYLSFRREYLVDSSLVLAVRITHGDCRWNPLYRLFPLQTTVKKQFSLSQVKPNGE